MKAGITGSDWVSRRADVLLENIRSRNPGIELDSVVVDDPDAALLEGSIDFYLMPLVDVPVRIEDGTFIAAMSKREESRDVVLGADPDILPAGSRVGVSSERANRIVSEAYPDLVVETIPWDSDDIFDAMVLSAPEADEEPVRYLNNLPSPTQGMVAAVCRTEDKDMRSVLSCMDDRISRLEAGVERGILNLMGAGSFLPIGIRAVVYDDHIHVDSVSYGFTDLPRRSSNDLAFDYVLDEILDIAEYLTGKRD